MMSLPQRAVLVVAAGVALAVAWLWWYSGAVPADGGWFAYAPNTQVTDTYLVVRKRQIVHLLIPLGMVASWTALSLWLLAPTHLRPDE